jgi:hypothetical protein
MAASAAKAAAEQTLALLWRARTRATLHLPWRRGAIRPGTSLRLEGQAGLWRVRRWTLEQMVIVLELVACPSGSIPAAAGSPGRPTLEADLLHGPTKLVVLDLPLSGEPPSNSPMLLVAAAGREQGWRAAPLLVSFDGGGRWEGSARTAAPAAIGDALTALAEAGAAIIDSRNSLDVEMLGDGAWLESCTDAALVGGANLAALGDELIQFGSAEPLGPRRFRLSRLLRGRRGTEWAAKQHQPGDPFVLIINEALARIEVPASGVGARALVLPGAVGDAEAEPVAKDVTGEALRPPSPVHLRAETHPDGGRRISWVRRSRMGWTWLGGVDAPLGEEVEAYRLTLSGPGFRRVAEVSEPTFTYGPAEQAEDGSGGPLTIEVAQVGTSGLSRPARLLIG